MRLHRRHFDAIAAILNRAIHQNIADAKTVAALTALAHEFANMFAAADANFNRATFLQKATH
jgi:hypothetical protein